MPVKNSADRFDAYYYQHDCGKPYERTAEWLGLFAHIAQAIVQRIGPGTVLDAGCAKGFLVEALRDRGVEAFGIDLSDYALQCVRADIVPYVRKASVCQPLPQRYELIVTIEVLEHLSPEEGERAVENLCQASDDILFSSTPFDFKEATHINVQPPEYWAEIFARNGFFRDCDFDASFLTPWAIRFRRLTEPVHRLVRAYERGFWRVWKENCDLRDAAIQTRDQLAAQEQQLAEKGQQLSAREQGITEMQDSSAWRLAQKLLEVQTRWAPPGSSRHRLLQKLWGNQ